MSYEFVNMFPYNAGVILANLPTMRQNYDAFVAMMLDNNDGLYYPNYGPADQGIINKVRVHCVVSVPWASGHGRIADTPLLFASVHCGAARTTPGFYMVLAPSVWLALRASLLLQFYEKDLRQRMLDPVFNTKPYNPFEQLTFILHFHGPKPLDLLNFVTTGKCDFFTICENAFLK
jgi:hypothetical protein